eukprot:TRINITY_DN497_c0_g2_i3.p1 TRINITY_DN497_c0_g2~~TRINITY_DN497_c0_g2_i3.p1  ORF type:complete len:101 (+),score=4.63 TRINITY_DN497_c0_g2_i3:58-360(+)
MAVVQDVLVLLAEFKDSPDTIRKCCMTLVLAVPPMDGKAFREYIDTLVQVLHNKHVISTFLHALVNEVPEIRRTVQWTDLLARQHIFFSQTKGSDTWNLR